MMQLGLKILWEKITVNRNRGVVPPPPLPLKFATDLVRPNIVDNYLLYLVRPILLYTVYSTQNAPGAVLLVEIQLEAQIGADFFSHHALLYIDSSIFYSIIHDYFDGALRSTSINSYQTDVNGRAVLCHTQDRMLHEDGIGRWDEHVGVTSRGERRNHAWRPSVYIVPDEIHSVQRSSRRNNVMAYSAFSNAGDLCI